jgi:hypothetical protein
MKRTIVAVILLAGMAAMPAAAVAGRGDAGAAIASPSSRSYGKSYADFAAEWWQWAISLPASGHPLFSSGSVDCSTGQSGHVWNLAGAFVTSGDPTERSCAIPSGTALLLPLVNVECSTLEPPPFFGADEAGLRACVQEFEFTDLHASVDGVEIGDLDRFLVEWSPLFGILPPADNILDVVGGSEGVAIARGVHLLLQPLSIGEHVVTFGGTTLQGSASFDFDVTYRLTVLPRGQFS